MNKKLFKISLIGFIFVSVLGTICHFLYDFSNKNIVVALICPVNESPWEHLKLLFFPFMIYTIITKHKLKQDKFNIYFSAYISIISGMFSVLSYYYTFNGIIGGNNAWVNISSFFVGVGVIFVVDYILLNNSVGKGMINSISALLLILTIITFILFTFNPPIIPLFKDPQSLTYGIG